MASLENRLEGRAAVVTGVASGIGTEVARACSQAGANVLGCDVNDGGGATAMDGIGEYVHADVASEADITRLVGTAVERFGGLDVMVNNAAIEIEKELTETTEEDFDRILAVNLKGVFFGCKHAVRAMRADGGGSIVNIASILAIVGDGILAAYCAAKAGVLGITRATAVQYAREGIRCNAVCPGDVDTPLVQAYFDAAEDPEARRSEVSARYPLERIARPEEVARAVVFMASDDSSFVNGHPLIVDGGLLATCY